MSVRCVRKLEYDAEAVLADAIAEGITSVINYPKPRLRINEFKKLVKGGEGLFDGVTYRDVPTVFISEAATLRATMQGWKPRNAISILIRGRCCVAMAPEYRTQSTLMQSRSILMTVVTG